MFHSVGYIPAVISLVLSLSLPASEISCWKWLEHLSQGDVYQKEVLAEIQKQRPHFGAMVGRTVAQVLGASLPQHYQPRDFIATNVDPSLRIAFHSLFVAAVQHEIDELYLGPFQNKLFLGQLLDGWPSNGLVLILFQHTDLQRTTARRLSEDSMFRALPRCIVGNGDFPVENSLLKQATYLRYCDASDLALRVVPQQSEGFVLHVMGSWKHSHVEELLTAIHTACENVFQKWRVRIVIY